MEPLITLSGIAAAIDVDNLDTDQLMPKQFLRGIDKAGLGEGLLYNRRHRPDGTLDPDFVLNRPGFEQTVILAAGPNFGCGSSREHAVWGLLQHGIRAVIAPSFGEIFYSNAFANGLLAAKVSPEDGEAIIRLLDRQRPSRLVLSVEDRTIRTADGSQTWRFSLSERHQTMLLEGLDMIGATLKDADAIAAFRSRHEAQFPWMMGLPGKFARARKQQH